MNKELEIKIEKIKSLVTTDELKKDIVEIHQDGNKNLINYLEMIGAKNVEYEIEAERVALMQEKCGNLNLWYKSINGTWIINLYNINQFKK